MPAHFAQYLESVAVRQHNIEEREIRRAFVHQEFPRSVTRSRSDH
jgi:hypothetical protein